MPSPEFRGASDHEVLDPHKQIRPSGTLLKEISASLSDARAAGVVLIFLGIATLLLPVAANIFFVLGLVFFLWKKSSVFTEHLPMRMPRLSRRRDYGDPVPGRKSFFKAGGIFYLGNAFDRMLELWAAKKDLLTHMLVLGTTGAGKSEGLLSLSFNFLVMGSGLLYVDPKAAPKLYAQICYMARIVGAEDDLRLINFMQEASPLLGNNPKRMTNTLNPLSDGTAEDNTQVMNSLIEVSGGDNAVFGQEAMNMMASLMFGVADLRDLGRINLSIPTLREYATADKMIALSEDRFLSPRARRSIRSFLEATGYRPGAPKQTDQFYTQFGYRRSYFSQVLNSLADSYSGIFGAHRGEASMKDIILQRRIGVGMLPSLKKAPAEVRNLGKIILSQVKIATGVGLGDGIEGTAEDILGSLPTDARTPFGALTDEYAAIALKGYVQMATQARGLGVCSIVGSQDFAGIRSADQDEAEQLVANMKIKVFMAQEDPKATWELAKELGGEVDVMRTSGLKIDPKESMGINYKDQLSTQIQRMGRIDLRDLMRQIEGEFHLFTKGEMIRGQMFYANPEPPKSFQIIITQLVPVPSPDRDYLESLYGKTRDVIDVFRAMIDNHDANDEAQEREAVPDSLGALIEGFEIARHGSRRAVEGARESAVTAFLHSLAEPAIGGVRGLAEAMKASNGDKAESFEGVSVEAEPSAKDKVALDAGEETLTANPESIKAKHSLAGDSADDDDEDDLLPSFMDDLRKGDAIDVEPEQKLEGASDKERVADKRVADKLAQMAATLTEQVVDKELESDLAKAEELLGASESEADASAKRVVQHVKESLHYPTAPFPTKDGAPDEDDLNQAMADLMRRSESRV